MRITAMPMRIGAPRVTAADVAAKAGVSQPTVSLVLSGNPKARVADATRARILRVAEELGYRPNRLAQALARKRSFALGIIVPQLDNPVFAHIISGAEKVAAQAGFAVLLAETEGGSPLVHIEALRDRQIDGVLVVGFGPLAIPASTLDVLNVVLVDQRSDEHPSLAVDSLKAGQLAAEHLLSLGHQRIAFIGPATDADSFRLRERGFAQRLRTAGFPLASDALRRAEATLAGGTRAMRALLALRPRPTAVFCANDLMALGAQKAATVAGLSLPRDLSLIGCDGIDLGQLVTPELSTVVVPQRELGARAARLLLRRLEGEPASAPAQLLAVKLTPRGSTGPAPAQ